MKKGLIITLTLTLMVLFVGCGISSQLAGTKWTRTYTREIDGEDFFATVTETFEFNDDDTFKQTITEDYPSELIDYEDEIYELDGIWFVRNDNTLYLCHENNPIGEFVDVVILEDELIFKLVKSYIKYKKVD